ncbi:hypothetical protein BJV78DRAFT_1129034 [Lactifluus subvellereus]|nr:hypothetical protein BJV78DRAFT_1129034 [Lactifluus subvellereus]
MSDFDLDVSPTHPRESIDACVESADWAEFDPSGWDSPPRFDVWQRVELTLPSNADDIFLLSKAVHALGILRVVEAADRDDIGVEVIVGHQKDSDLFEKSSVCTLLRRDNGHGVGIFTPRPKHRPHEQDMLFYNITVSLPGGKEVIAVPHFETRLPLFHHEVQELPTHTFDSIFLHSSNGFIFAQNLVGKRIAIRTRNAPIGGTFNTSSSLNIKASNSPVMVAVNAFNQDNSSPTKVKIRTKNSPLVADLSLFSTHENKTSGAFVVNTHTSNSPLEVDFLDQAPDSLLKFDAHTRNAPARVRLHPSFEGRFELKTSILPSVVTPDDDVEDPAGRGRKRTVNVTVGHGAWIVHGDAAWVPEDPELAPAGKVKVSTRNAPLLLQL